ncbi:hypothetical protein UACE39S_05204 [Ureibacillus acetophenoni]
MKKMIRLFTLGLTIMLLTACGGGQEASKPADVVTSFMKAIQSGDLEKASTFVSTENVSDDFDFASMKNANEDPATEALVKGMSNNYKFGTPKENNVDDQNAEVTVEVTSLDYAAVMQTAMEDIFSAAFELALEDQTEEEYNQAMDEKSTEILTAAMTDKDAPTVTRDVTLNLTKDADGNFKIVSDANLMEAVLGNSAEVEEMFSELE